MFTFKEYHSVLNLPTMTLPFTLHSGKLKSRILCTLWDNLPQKIEESNEVRLEVFEEPRQCKNDNTVKRVNRSILN